MDKTVVKIISNSGGAKRNGRQLLTHKNIQSHGGTSRRTTDSVAKIVEFRALLEAAEQKCR